MSTPTCVQHVRYHSNENFETGNAFKIKLPNATLSSNCLVLFMTYPYSATRTVSITDDASNSWPSTPTVKTDDTANNLTTAVFVLPGATAGVTVITITFDAAIYAFNPSFSEWYNVATSSPLDGSSSANLVIAGSQAGSFSTTTDGDLILHFGIDTSWGNQYNSGYFGGGIASIAITKQSGYTLLQASSYYLGFLQYQVQGTHGATNPNCTFSGGSISGDSWSAITIALKSASAGTAPSATDTRVFGVHHERTTFSASGNYKVLFPTTGNLACMTTAYGRAGCVLNSLTGAVGGSFTVISDVVDYPQFAYKTSLTASDTESFTLNVTPGGSSEFNICFYDVVNAGAFDTSAHGSAGTFGPGSQSGLPSITPGVSAGIAIGCVGLGTGPPNGLSAPTGAVFLSGEYTGYTDLSPWESGDCYGFIYFTSAANQNWTWSDSVSTGSALATAASFAGTFGGGGSPSGNIAWITA